jgi:phosphatidylserine decarboxylase
MNVFNVHVNRSPLPGNVIKTEHRPGKKLNAAIARAEYENECGDTDIETSDGLIRIRQIAGLIARRVVTRVKPGDLLERGSIIGLIRFGSRVDVFLPATFKSTVKKGEKVKAGITVIATKS